MRELAATWQRVECMALNFLQGAKSRRNDKKGILSYTPKLQKPKNKSVYLQILRFENLRS
jgi:hypothetical protein